VKSLETDVLKVRLENLVKCAITDKQVETFVGTAEKLGMEPIKALEYLEGLKLSKEEIQNMIRGL
jgi:hypothetical protein